MNLKLEIEFSKADIFKQVDALKKQIDKERPLSSDIEGRVMQKLRLDWNYHSNAIEGNQLNYGETIAFLMTGITAKGKPLKDHLDIRGHNEAINFLLSIIKDPQPLTESEIRSLHKMILVEPYEIKAITAEGQPTIKHIKLGEYKSLPNHVKTVTGEIYYYTSPEETPIKMSELLEWYTEVIKNKKIHPVVIAARFHHKFVSIHPFDDGNGRLSRILMNLILMKNNYPPVVIKKEDRQNYYALLSQADADNNWPFTEYIAERLQSSLELYKKAINGDDVNEDEDIDKEIALFKFELQNKVTPKKKITQEEINELLTKTIYPFIDKLLNKISVFAEFFEEAVISLEPTPSNGIEIVNYLIKNHAKAPVYDSIKHLVNSGKKLQSIYITLQFNNFKNPDNVFSISQDLSIEFDDQEYSITDINDIQVYKFYSQELSNVDQDNIIRGVVRGIKYRVDESYNE